MSLCHLQLPPRRLKRAQPQGAFKWCWHTWFIFKDMVTNFIAAWDMLTTNKKVGGLYLNDGDANAFAADFPPVFMERGYGYIDLGRYQNSRHCRWASVPRSPRRQLPP